MKTPHIVLIILTIFCGNLSIAQEIPRKLIFGVAGVKDTNQANRIGTEILKAISKKIGHEIELLALPPKRAQYMLKKGQIDADIARFSSFGDSNASLIMVNEPFLKVPFYAYTMSPDIKIHSIECIKPYRIVTLRGIKLIKHRVKDLDVQLVDSIKSGFLFLYKNRADIFINDGISAKKILNSPEIKKLGIIRLEPPLIIAEVHTFFTPSNADIAKKYERALIEIKQEGIYDKILRDTMPFPNKKSKNPSKPPK